MHRMRYFFAAASLFAALVLNAEGKSARGALLEPNHTRNFPDVTAYTNGYQNYYVDSPSQGTFQLKDVPFLITMGKTGTDFVEYDVTRAGDGQLAQNVTAVINTQTGELISGDSRNAFSLYGKVTIGGDTFDGLLLQGTPTGFGYQALTSSGVTGKALFDMKIKITGGALADLYGAEAYLSITADTNSTFAGVFTQDFSSQKILTNLQKYTKFPNPVPEPTTLVVLVTAGAGLLYRNRRKITARDLQLPE